MYNPYERNNTIIKIRLVVTYLEMCKSGFFRLIKTRTLKRTIEKIVTANGNDIVKFDLRKITV